VAFWKKMVARESGDRPPKWLSTHPSSTDRIANLQRLAPGLVPTYEQAKARIEGGAAATNANPRPAPTPPTPAGVNPALTRPTSSSKPTTTPPKSEQQELDQFLGR
jgi:hypothetical protein